MVTELLAQDTLPEVFFNDLFLDQLFLHGDDTFRKTSETHAVNTRTNENIRFEQHYRCCVSERQYRVMQEHTQYDE